MTKMNNNLKALFNAIQLKEKEPETIQDYAIKFVNDFYNTITKVERENKLEHKSSSTFKPSSMKCPRNMQFQIMQVEPETSTINPSMTRIGESGTDAHLRLQHWIDKMDNCEYVNVAQFIRQRQEVGQLLDLEIVREPTEEDMECKLYNKKYNISFMCDGIIKYLDRYFILEIKTESTYKNSKRTAMAEEHIPQICAYYLSLGIPDVMMLYENRDTCQHKAYAVSVTDSMVREFVTSKIDEVNNSIANNTYASAYIGKHCQYCLYAKRCREIK